jgi:alpha-tubulin suppressor-like RCC1 family protein
MSDLKISTLTCKIKNNLEKCYFDEVSTDAVDVLSQFLSAKNIKEPNIISVLTTEFLPNLKYYDSPSGMLYFVEDLGVFAVSSNDRWLTLDGRILIQYNIFGQIWSWGFNSSGQLGTNTITARSSPVSVVGGFTDWCQVSAGCLHSLGLRTNGTAWAWGCNGNGRLGTNDTINRSSPVSVVGGFTDWCQLAAGGYTGIGVRTNGTLWSWGFNSSGQLGTNTIIARSSPVSVVGGFTDWCQVSAGCLHSLGLRTNGTAWAWGFNSSGQLGDNTVTARSSPVSVVGGFTDWCQVSGGQFHSLALRINGTAWAWGLNSSGQLGDNTQTARSSPVSVLGGFTDWCQVSAGRCHSLGVRTNGTAWAWGDNGQGRLGDNTQTARSSPVSVLGGFTDWCQVSAGGSHSLGLRTNGTAWAWGFNGNGQLGDNTITDRSSPVSVVSGFTDWNLMSAGVINSLALKVR